MTGVISIRARALMGLLASLLLLALPAAAQEVGVAIAVTQGATIEVGGRTTRLTARDLVSNGAVIRTDQRGTVQLLFRDRTRIVVGPLTTFRIDDVAMKSDGTAQRFAVTTLGGMFRFLTGRSPKPAYKLNTPTATLGIRGTVFDLAFDTLSNTRLVTFDGEVRFCGRGRRCAIATGGCSMVRATAFGSLKTPEDKNERDAVLNTLFPFVIDQRGLGGQFRARTESCGDIDPRLRLVLPAAQLTAPGSIRRDNGGGSTGGGSSSGGGSGGGGQKDEP